MKLHRGRLIDHIHLRARNLSATQGFYRALLGALGLEPVVDDRHLAIDELWIDALGSDKAEASHVHLAFQAADEAMVRTAWEAALAAGGRDNGAPGTRDYHPGYYAAFLLDPDGNNIEVVVHGPAERSADSVEISFDPQG